MGARGDFLGEIETIIIGAGQAGLSVGRYLQEGKRPFLIVEKNARIGVSWEEKYDSLVLDSFAKYSSLPGFPFPGDPFHQLRKDEVADYLQRFTDHFDIRPQYNMSVLRVKKSGEYFVVTTNRGVYHSRFVVLAIGPFSVPHIPEGATDIPGSIYKIHSTEYRNPKQLKDGPTLVVGGGNSGAEIAEEIAESGRKVYFSFKGRFKSVKSSPLSQWLAYRLGLAHVPKNSWLGKIILWYTKGKAVGVDVKSLLQHPNVHSVGAFLGSTGKEIICAKKKLTDVSNIIWATGYESDFSIISIPGFRPDSQKRGVTNIPGLYVLNIRWQHSKSSSHLAGVSRDAKYIAGHIASERNQAL